MSENNETPRDGVSRRTVTKAMAWTVPVIAVAATVPQAAASPPIVPTVVGGTFCKHPGNPKYYHALLTFKNTTNAAITVTLGTLTVGAVSNPAFFSAGGSLTSTFVIPALSTSCLYVDSGLFDNSANGSATFTISYPGSGGFIPVSAGSVDDKDLPPCGTGADPSDPKQPGDDPAHDTSGACQV